METETGTALIISVFCLAIAFLVTLLFIASATSKRRILEKENLLRQMEAKRQVELFRVIAKAEENQKARIARNLHDQILPILLLRTGNINNQLIKLKKEGVDVTQIQKEINSLTNLSEEIREISHDLIPKLFHSWGLLKSIESYVNSLNKAGGAIAEFSTSSYSSADPPFSVEDQLIIYRICLEILNNLYKHANYKYLSVSLEKVNNELEFVFAHDGKGISNDEIKHITMSDSGMGLKSIQSRALLLNAKIDYFVDKDVSHVKLSVPLVK